MRKVQILSWLLQNVKLGRRVQRDQQRFDRRQELHLREFIAIKGGGRPARLLSHAKMLLVPINVSFCWVDYALEGSTFLLSNVILAACFTLRGHVVAHTVLMWFLFLVGRICPLMQEHFLWPLFKHKAFYCGLTFLQSALWIWRELSDFL